MRAQFAAWAAIGLFIFSNSAFAHHGWAWTTGNNIELTGVITSVRLGNPHGWIEVNVDGEIWTLEVGQQKPGSEHSFL